MKHTLGPWTVNNDDLLSTFGVYGDGFFIAEVMLAEDAQLIAAAPELLKALENLERTAGIAAMKDDQVRVAARAAIAKANGKA